MSTLAPHVTDTGGEIPASSREFYTKEGNPGYLSNFPRTLQLGIQESDSNPRLSGPKCVV